MSGPEEAPDPWHPSTLRDRLQRFVQHRWDDLDWKEVELFEDIDMFLIMCESSEP